MIINITEFSDKMAAKTSRKVDDDLANVEFETSEDVEVIPTFDSMGLREDLLRYALLVFFLQNVGKF